MDGQRELGQMLQRLHMAEDSLELEDMLQRLRVAEDKAPTDEERAARLQRVMGLLAHASACADPRCAVRHCSKIKALFHHAAACPVHLGGGCQYCHRTWALLQSHANMCTAACCTVPRCRELKQLHTQWSAGH